MRCANSLPRRLTVRLTLGVGIAAVLIGRGALPPVPEPEPAADHWRGAAVYASPRYRAYDGTWFPPDPHAPRLLDRETGVVSMLPLPDTESFEGLGCSPWQDDAGRFRLVGRWLRVRRGDGQALPLAVGLAWCHFPAGKIVERIALDQLPTGNLCWYPDGSGRVLFAQGGRLYHVAFPGKDAATGACSEEARQARLLNWRDAPPGHGVDYIRDLHWPGDGALSLRCLLLASLIVLQPGASVADRGGWLWWLDLGCDGTEIVAAGRLIAPDPTEALRRRAEERLPVLGTTQDGRAMLAYLAREDGCNTWDLWLTPIAPCPAGTVRSLSLSAGRRVARGCEAAVPTFSADGQWIYVFRHSPATAPRLERVPVAPGDDPTDLHRFSGHRLRLGSRQVLEQFCERPFVVLPARD
jgi:hypothetical protein